MKRLGLSGRLLLVVILGFVVVELLAIFAYLDQRGRALQTEHWLPFPDQLAAVVTLFDGADEAERRLLERAFSSGSVLVTVADAGAPGPAAELRDLPRLAAMIEAYGLALRGREVRVSMPAEESFAVFPGLFGIMQADSLVLSVGLADGRALTIRRRDTTALSLGGLPAGLFAGLVGAVLALATMLVVWRETRPLRDLRVAAERFGQTLAAQPMRARGAPDLKALIAAFNDMQARIVALDQGRTDMIAAIGHDIRTPLTRLRLRLRHLDATLQDAAERDIDAVTRVADEAARFAAADLAPDTGRVDLREILSVQAEQPEVTFTDAQPDQPALVLGNAELMSRAVENIVANALTFGARCRIALSIGAADLTVTLDDDGPGIAPEDRARLLAPFARGEGARSLSHGGSGLGLALADRILRRHGGRLELKEAPGGGLCVVLTFPRASTEADGRASGAD